MNALLLGFLIILYLIVGRVVIHKLFENEFFSDFYEDDQFVIWLRVFTFPVFLIFYCIECISMWVFDYFKKL
jgi:hypothetical protein